MTASAASPNGHRLLAVIAPGAGPHLVGPPSTSHWTTRPARSHGSLAAGPWGSDAAGALRDLCRLHGQRGTPEVLERWIARRERGAEPAG